MGVAPGLCLVLGLRSVYRSYRWCLSVSVKCSWDKGTDKGREKCPCFSMCSLPFQLKYVCSVFQKGPRFANKHGQQTRSNICVKRIFWWNPRFTYKQVRTVNPAPGPPPWSIPGYQSDNTQRNSSAEASNNRKAAFPFWKAALSL